MKRHSLVLLAWLLAYTMPTLSAQNLKETIEKGIQTSIRQSENRLWREAFATCRALDAQAEQDPELHYLVACERFRLYSRLKKGPESKAQMNLMESYARASKKKDVIEEMLMKKADHALLLSNKNLAEECYREILDMHIVDKDDSAKEKCFQNMIAKAKSNNKSLMAGIIGKMYGAWTDSIEGIRREQELNTVKSQYAEALEDLDNRKNTIATQRAIIGIAAGAGIGLGVALLFFFFLTLRNRRVIKRLRKHLKEAEENNTRKSGLLLNIGAQIQPSLDAMEQGDTKRHLQALRSYIGHIGRYLELEQSRNEHYELACCDMAQFCEKFAQEVRDMAKGVAEVTNNTQHIKFRTHEETLHALLSILIAEIVKDSRVERINLDFKKRNTHTGNLLVTAVGMTLPQEQHDTLFQAFTQLADLTESDGLAYPTCRLMAGKLGGELCLDETFGRGIRFVIVLKEY